MVKHSSNSSVCCLKGDVTKKWFDIISRANLFAMWLWMTKETSLERFLTICTFSLLLLYWGLGYVDYQCSNHIETSQLDLLCKAVNWFPYEEISDELSTQRLRWGSNFFSFFGPKLSSMEQCMWSSTSLWMTHYVIQHSWWIFLNQEVKSN